MEKIKFAILGPGSIARGRMIKPLSQNPDAELYAVASRDIDRAREFADEFGFTHAYGSYEQMLLDPKVDVVYISTLNNSHYEHTKLCLEYNKHVICEKPFAINTLQAREMLDLAKSKNLFVMEAMWSRFLPGTLKLHKLLKGGVIGDIQTIIVTLGIRNNLPRLLLPELGGGALLDLGVYTTHFILGILGADIVEIETCMTPIATNVDGQGTVILKYRNGVIAVMNFSIVADYTNIAMIYGDRGRIEVPNFAEAEVIKVFRKGMIDPAIHYTPFESTGFEYQIHAAITAIRDKKIEPQKLPHSETINVMQILDKIRRKWGLYYPAEKNI